MWHVCSGGDRYSAAEAPAWTRPGVPRTLGGSGTEAVPGRSRAYTRTSPDVGPRGRNVLETVWWDAQVPRRAPEAWEQAA
ncbi:hypothetical protein GCM10010446_11240 [Streptomyces enissocaesilis]|uniref:Uncharacterized protein n=1 Tax=Streptomyces enissocaesilis TaxID=332589 RepID=A0ABN3WWY1_9ACTN